MASEFPTPETWERIREALDKIVEREAAKDFESASRQEEQTKKEQENGV